MQPQLTTSKKRSQSRLRSAPLRLEMTLLGRGVAECVASTAVVQRSLGCRNACSSSGLLQDAPGQNWAKPNTHQFITTFV